LEKGTIGNDWKEWGRVGKHWYFFGRIGKKGGKLLRAEGLIRVRREWK